MSEAKKLKACIVELQALNFKVFKILLQQNGYDVIDVMKADSITKEIISVSPHLVIVNVDLGDEGEGEKIFIELMRSQDLSLTLICISTEDVTGKVASRIGKTMKVDGTYALPLNAMNFTNSIKALKEKRPKRDTWRSSWK